MSSAVIDVPWKCDEDTKDQGSLNDKLGSMFMLTRWDACHYMSVKGCFKH